jgi:hypothetical protein
MASKTTDSANSSSRVLTAIWLLVSAGLAYPVYSLLISWGFNATLAATSVFLGICLLYDIPYRARVNAQHQAAMSRADQWNRRSC